MPKDPFILIDGVSAPGVLRVVGSEADHLSRVLRASPGFRITGFDGAGSGWLAEVESVRRGEVLCRALEPLPAQVDLAPGLQVGVAVIKGRRMDYAVEKASEIGAEALTPLLTDRSVIRPGKGRITRWRSIALASAKQSRRLTLMRVGEPIALREFVDSSRVDRTVWAFHNDQRARSLVEVYRSINTPPALTLLIGPEGGFTPAEVDFLAAEGIELVRLGVRPLRTETAVAVALGMVKNLASDL